ncbi:MAG: response regulator transcription factor [Geminicoccaceae bacterium]
MAELIVVEDDLDVREMVSAVLEQAGHKVREVGSAAELRLELERAPADLVVLDVTLPKEDGLSVARELGARAAGPGVLVLSGLGESADRVAGLEAGADDYMVKPFEPEELTARVEMILRRRKPTGRGPQLGPWRIDEQAHAITHPDGRTLHLTPGELALVAVFARHPGRVLTRDELLDIAPGRDGDPFDRSIDHRIARLRRKLGDDGRHQDLIRSVRGRGYVHRG